MSDILIIGGGIAGLSAAAELAPHGAVTIIEAEDALGYHASGRSAAAFVPGYGNPVIRALTEASRATFEASGTLTQRGMMLLARHGEDESFAREARDFSLDEIDVASACDEVPLLRAEAIARVGHKAGVWDIDTDALLQSYRRKAQVAGARIVTGQKVQAIHRDGGQWDVRSANESWQAETLVNAAGAWADDIARLAGVRPLGITPYRRSMARIALPDEMQSDNWPFLDSVNERWYAKPDAGALIVSPADEEPTTPHDAFADDMVLAEGLARYEEMATVPVTRLLANWAGLRSFAPDRALVLGRDRTEPAFVWCAGQGGYGFQTAPGAAALLADHMLGRAPTLDPEIVAALHPSRFE